MDDRACIKAQHRHDDRDINKDPGREVWEIWAAQLQQLRHPAIRAEFGGGEWADGDEHDEEKPVAKRASVKTSQHTHTTSDAEDRGPGGLLIQHLSQSRGHQRGDDEEPDGTDFLQHVTVAHASSDTFIDRECAGQDEQGIDHHRDEAERKTELPHGSKEQLGVWQQRTKQGTKGETGGPACMKDVQPFGLLFIKDRCHHGIDEGLDRAIRHRDEQRAPVKILITGSPQRQRQ